MARIIPISTRRSAASMTKMRKISIMPDAMAKRPRTTKNVVRKLEMVLALSTASCLVSVAWNFAVPITLFSAAVTVFELSRPS